MGNKYANQAVESFEAKQQRNNEIDAAISFGDGNVVGDPVVLLDKDGVTHISRKNVPRRKLVLMKVSSADIDTSGQAAKRARLKAKRSKKVSDYKHAESRCGNAGCSRCFP